MKIGTVGMTDREVLEAIKQKFAAAPTFARAQVEPIMLPLIDLLERVVTRLESHDAELIAMDGGIANGQG